MKKQSIIIGFIVGIITGIILAIAFHSIFQRGFHHPAYTKDLAQEKDSTSWSWPDSLDAVKAAPKNHHVIFENNKIRILEVILNPYEYEQLHVHRLPSVMFGAVDGSVSSGSLKDNKQALPFDIIYYRYGYDSLHHIYYVKDSNKQHSDPPKPDEPNTGSYMLPEGPHRIKNLSNVKIDVFRVEIKPETKR